MGSTSAIPGAVRSRLGSRGSTSPAVRDGRPEFAVECKSGERRSSPACRYFRERTDIPRFYQVHLGTRDYGDAGSDTRVLPFAAFCAEVPLP